MKLQPAWLLSAAWAVCGGIGSALLTAISEALHVARQYHVIAYGVFLCLVIVFLPDGIWGSLENALRKRRIKKIVRESEAS